MRTCRPRQRNSGGQEALDYQGQTGGMREDPARGDRRFRTAATRRLPLKIKGKRGTSGGTRPPDRRFWRRTAAVYGVQGEQAEREFGGIPPLLAGAGPKNVQLEQGV